MDDQHKPARDWKWDIQQSVQLSFLSAFSPRSEHNIHKVPAEKILLVEITFLERDEDQSTSMILHLHIFDVLDGSNIVIDY